MATKTYNERFRRFDNEKERDLIFMRWITKNGVPKFDQGCICCAEIVCIKNCHGITDKRVKLMTGIIIPNF
jgi:hypothetical protein